MNRWGYVWCCVIVLKFSASLCNAYKLGLETSKYETGDGFCSVVMRSNVALVAASVEDMPSIVMLCGKKATVSEFRDELAVGKLHL